MADDIFGEYPPAKWEVGGKVITFTVDQIRERGGKRVPGHPRLYRDGERLDDLGLQATIFELTCLIHNNTDEEGVPTNQYPTTLNELIDSFAERETGTLTLPTRGPKRCKPETWERVEASDKRDAAACVFTFKVDSEDDDTAEAFQAPAARSVASTIAGEAVAACELEGLGGFSIGSLIELAASLEALATEPSAVVGDLEAAAEAIQRRVESIEDTYAQSAVEGVEEAHTLMSDPSASLAGRRLRSLADTAARVVQEQAQLGPALVSKTWPVDLSIFDIASQLGQDPADLIDLNQGLADLFLIPFGTPVLIYEP